MNKQVNNVMSILLWIVCGIFIYRYFDLKLAIVLFFAFWANNLQQKKN